MGDNYAKDQRKSIRHRSANNVIDARTKQMAEKMAKNGSTAPLPTCNRCICSVIGYYSVYFS